MNTHANAQTNAHTDAQIEAPTSAPLTAVHLLRAEEVSAAELSTLHSLARIVLQADGRPLLHHLQAWTQQHEADLEARNDTSTTTVPVVPVVLVVPAVVSSSPAFGSPNASISKGKFAAEGGHNAGAFSFDVSSRQRPPRPWINVLANPDFGCQISEAGGGYTWALNSRMNQLTAWSNDPLADPAAEWLLLQDRRSGAVWSAAPGVHAAADVTYRVAHTQGSTQIQHQTAAVRTANASPTDNALVTVTWCVDAHESVKHITLHILNQGPRKLKWRLAAGVEWLMGAVPADRRTAQTEFLRSVGNPRNGAASAGTSTYTALLCTQHEHSGGFGAGSAFFAMLLPAKTLANSAGLSALDSVLMAATDDHASEIDWTCDRREFFDARGRMVLPDHLGQRSGAGLDPCAALAVNIDLAPGAETTLTCLLGYAANANAGDAGADTDDAVEKADVHKVLEQAVRKSTETRHTEVRALWQHLLQATQVKTPDPLFDSLVNHWLLYQTLSCRMWAKAGFYQAGGATGFRDQLQDAMALSWAAPQLLREQILRCASRQYAEGDVQHWWHSPGGAGVRTHFSDDLLWLPWALAHYLNTVGDGALLDTQVAFIEGSQIPTGAEDIYETPRISPQSASVFEHAARSIDRSLKVGVHGLPLMGSGDWNDGMNRVGHEGKGESVWLAWFLCKLVADFSPIARRRGESARAETWERAAANWKVALEGQAWDGAWYKRAFFDDGSALGSAANAEARIDLIAQAWAVLSGSADAPRQVAAMAAVQSHLVDAQSGLIQLLAPPLQSAVPSAGYIQAYPPGVRENGGQYSHGAVWALMAQAKLHTQQFAGTATDALAQGDLPYTYFTRLSPAHRAAHAQWGAAYELEPYVMAGDVYTHAPFKGRGGWSWYTGAAAWMHRAAVESIFGLTLGASELTLQPCLPSHWNEAEISLKRDGRVLRFVLCRSSAAQWMAAHADVNAQELGVGCALNWADLLRTDAPLAQCFVTQISS